MARNLLGQSDVTIFQLDVARGIFPNASWVDKYGADNEINAGDITPTAPKLVWEYGRQFGNSGGQYVYPDWEDTVNFCDTIAGSDIADVSLPILVQGLDIAGNYVSQVVTTDAVDGRVAVPLTTPLWRVWRLINIHEDLATGQGRSVVGLIYAYVASQGGVTLGAPTPSSVRAIISDGGNQTLMCTYTIPKGLTGYLMEGEAGISRATSAGSSDLCYRSRRFGGAFTVKKQFSVSSGGSSYFQDTRSIFDPIPELTDIELCITSVSANGTGIWGTFDILLVDEAAETERKVSSIIAGL